MAGLQLICAIRSRFMVAMAVRRPMRAQARAASQPAWPAPMTTTSYRSGIATIVRGMKILVIGSGGREHALCWKLTQSEGAEVFACPGNPGMARVALCVPGDPLDAALRVGADLTVVGPEVPLVAGVVDAFRARGLRIVGPNADAARLEGSKIFAKDFFQQRGIPTAEYVTVEDASQARMALGLFGFPVVLKADGLAAGKGVVVAHAAAEAEAALGSLQGRLVIEEFLTGEEVSFIDRKSTRLNSSHLCSSYAVFCLKKKERDCIHHAPNSASGTRVPWTRSSAPT